jgi:hypothetical protein
MDEKINRIDAVNSLGFHNFHGPESGEFVFPDGETPPTEEVIQAEIVRLQAEYDSQAYARNRATEYPALAEQLDEIYHNGIDSWKAVIKVTKDKYPKG